MIVDAAAVAGALLTGPPILWLAHRCRSDRARCGAVETSAVVLLAGVVAAAAVPTGRLALVAPIGIVGTAAALVDVHERRLPNLLTGSLTLLIGAALAVAAVVSGDAPAAARSAGAALAVTVAAALLKVISPASIGWGDVKLLPPLAAALAWPGEITLYRGIVAWALLLLVTVGLWPLARVDRREAVPYGPALVAGALGTLLVVT